MTEQEECSYNGCQTDAVTTIGEEGLPSCQQHLQQVLEGDGGSANTGDRPVLSNGEDQAAWINTTDNGKTYLSVKVEDGEYVNLFAQTDLIQDALHRQHQVTQNE